MLTYDEAVARILSVAAPLRPVELPILECVGRTLAQGVAAEANIPRFENSSDGRLCCSLPRHRIRKR